MICSRARLRDLFYFLLLFSLLNGKKIVYSCRKGGNYECQYLSEETGDGDVLGSLFGDGMAGLFDHC